MKARMILQSSLVGLVVLILVCNGFPQGLEYVKSHYTKHEHTIRMRDGIRLFTAVYVPKDRSTTYPILLKRTPYNVGPYGADRYAENLGPSTVIGKEGYIFVYQDVRGRWMSEGEFEHVRPHRPEEHRDGVRRCRLIRRRHERRRRFARRDRPRHRHETSVL